MQPHWQFALAKRMISMERYLHAVVSLMPSIGPQALADLVRAALFGCTVAHCIMQPQATRGC